MRGKKEREEEKHMETERSRNKEKKKVKARDRKPSFNRNLFNSFPLSAFQLLLSPWWNASATWVIFFCFLNHRVSLKPDELNWTTVSNRRAVEIKKEEERRTRGLSLNHTHHKAERGRREQGRRELGGGGGGGATYWTGWIMLSVLA